MAQKGSKWNTGRINRLLEILDYKAQGFTDAEVAEKMPISRHTVSRELNSPQAAEIGRKLRNRAEGLVWTLVEKQLTQIEGDVSISPAQKLIYRGKLINTLAGILPKQIEQQIEATGDLHVIYQAWRPDYDKDEGDEDAEDKE